MDKSLLNAIRSGSFSKSQKKIADFILTNYKHVAFMTAASLAKAVDVSEATVVRFAAALGFDGYSEFQKRFRLETATQLTAVERMELASEKSDEAVIIKNVLKSDMDKIERTMADIDFDAFNVAVDTLLTADKIYIAGARSSASLANFAGFYFNLLFEKSKTVTGGGAEDITEQLFYAGEGDVVLGISFPRYSSGIVRAMEFARNRGAFVIALTDSSASPIVEFSSCTLIAKSAMDSFADSLVAPMSVLNALIFAIGYKRKNETKKLFDEWENIWKDYEVYNFD